MACTCINIYNVRAWVSVCSFQKVEKYLHTTWECFLGLGGIIPLTQSALPKFFPSFVQLWLLSGNPLWLFLEHLKSSDHFHRCLFQLMEFLRTCRIELFMSACFLEFICQIKLYCLSWILNLAPRRSALFNQRATFDFTMSMFYSLRFLAFPWPRANQDNAIH